MQSLVFLVAWFAFVCVSSPKAITATVTQLPYSTSTSTEILRINSRQLGEEREIEIYLPPEYATSKLSYPVVYALDGEGTGPVTANAVQFMTRYSSIPQMPNALVVGIKNVNRNRDLPRPQDFNKAGQDKFLAFLADELIPAVEQRYRTQPLRILLGHSQGGLFAVYALTAKPTVFQWYLAIDAPLFGFQDVKPLMEQVKELLSKSPNYRGRLATVENLYGWKKDWPSLMSAAPKGFYGAQIEIKDETHETMLYEGVYEGLKHLFHDYTPNTINHNQGIQTLPVLEARYASLSAAYGYKVDIPKQVLLEAAAHDTAMRYGAEAVALVKRAVDLYGASPATQRLLSEAQAAASRGHDPRQEEWAKLGPPDVERMKPFLGTWERIKDGAHWFMTFEVKDGVVVAQNSVTPPNGERVQLEVQFVRVIDNHTLQWGLINGLGGGTILHTGKLVDENTIEGMIEPVGIQHAPPPHAFVYTRRRK